MEKPNPPTLDYANQQILGQGRSIVGLRVAACMSVLTGLVPTALTTYLLVQGDAFGILTLITLVGVVFFTIVTIVLARGVQLNVSFFQDSLAWSAAAVGLFLGIGSPVALLALAAIDALAYPIFRTSITHP